MKRVKKEPTVEGFVATQLEKVIHSQEVDLLLSQIVADSPVFQWDMLMEDVLARVLRFMYHCRHLLQRGIPLTSTHLSAYVPTGNGESPRGSFALHPLFLRNGFPHFLKFDSSLAYETYYEGYFPLPQGYPPDGHFLASDDTVLPDVSEAKEPFRPVSPPKIGTQFAALLDHPRTEISIAGVMERRTVAKVSQDDHQVPVDSGQSCLFPVGDEKWEFRTVEEKVLQELLDPGPLAGVPGEDSAATRWDLIWTELREMMSLPCPQDWTDTEWEKFQREHPDPLSVSLDPVTSADPLKSLYQPVVPELSRFSRPGYVFSHFRECQIVDGGIEVFGATGVLDQENRRRHHQHYLCGTRDQAWPGLFHHEVIVRAQAILQGCCPPLAAALLLDTPLELPTIFRRAGRTQEQYEADGDYSLDHFYEKETEDGKRVPLALGMDIYADLVHMGACRGSVPIREALLDPGAAVWAQVKAHSLPPQSNPSTGRHYSPCMVSALLCPLRLRCRSVLHHGRTGGWNLPLSVLPPSSHSRRGPSFLRLCQVHHGTQSQGISRIRP